MNDTLDLEELKRLMMAASPLPWDVEPARKAQNPNGVFAMSAANSLPALIAIAEEVERLRAELKPYRDEHDRARRLVGDPIKGVSFPVRP